MRNTIEHPITKQEIVECLQELIYDIHYDQPSSVGDMRPLLLQKAIDIILTGRFDPA